MAISKESKQAIRVELENLSRKKKIVSREISSFERKLSDLNKRLIEIDGAMNKLTSDVNG